MRCLHQRCAAYEKVYRNQTPDWSIREVYFKIIGRGPLHNFLEKRGGANLFG